MKQIKSNYLNSIVINVRELECVHKSEGILIITKIVMMQRLKFPRIYIFWALNAINTLK